MEPPTFDSGRRSQAAHGRQLVAIKRVLGSTIFDRQGEKIGRVEDVMVHKENGHVAYAIMIHGGVLGAGGRYHPLPWSMLHFDVERNGYVVPLDRAQLEQAPTLDQTEIDSEDDRLWGQAVHSHFGLPGPFI
jgi:sporulation protein YlmC with PRC-barrel domain